MVCAVWSFPSQHKLISCRYKALLNLVKALTASTSPPARATTIVLAFVLSSIIYWPSCWRYRALVPKIHLGALDAISYSLYCIAALVWKYNGHRQHWNCLQLNKIFHCHIFPQAGRTLIFHHVFFAQQLELNMSVQTHETAITDWVFTVSFMHCIVILLLGFYENQKKCSIWRYYRSSCGPLQILDTLSQQLCRIWKA